MDPSRTEASDNAAQLPPLAPRASTQASQPREGRGRSGSSARPSSHRSRAGCWTCRGRKVKCDEVHPKCGPCNRLNKVCDWDQRWNFSDATRSTQNKFLHVDTTGNAVWDPNVPPTLSPQESGSSRRDSLPSFADLTNDEDRERKAEWRRPGTYNVIVNPDSFANTPEYASPPEGRRMSIQSLHGSMGSATSEPGRAIVMDDPNTVVLTRFEDAVPSLPSFFASTADRRPSLPGDMQRLDISTSGRPRTSSQVEIPKHTHRDSQLISHYEQTIAPRIMTMSNHHYDAEAEDPIIVESRVFAPLHHAICALSLMSLHHKGLARRQCALHRIETTTGLLSQSVRSKDFDLHSDGLFFLHFILLIYDTCNPVDDDNLWYRHVQHLCQTWLTRLRVPVKDSAMAFIIGHALCIDTQAALAGRDSGAGLARAHISNNLFTPFAPVFQPNLSPASSQQLEESEFVLSGVPGLSLCVTSMTARLGILALGMRNSLHSPQTPQAAQSMLLARQHAVQQYQAEFHACWARSHPLGLPDEDPTPVAHMPERLRYTYSAACLQRSICVIYSNTSMFPGQLLRNSTARPEVARHCHYVLDLTMTILRDGVAEPRVTGFAVFLAGFAATDYESKVRAIQLLHSLEERSLCDNVRRARELLIAVCEEQRQRVLAGGRAEEIDWLLFARARSMELLDFGL